VCSGRSEAARERRRASRMSQNLGNSLPLQVQDNMMSEGDEFAKCRPQLLYQNKRPAKQWAHGWQIFVAATSYSRAIVNGKAGSGPAYSPK
jgi:hypothetical protein